MKSRKHIDDPKSEHVVLSCADGASTSFSNASVSPVKLQGTSKSRKRHKRKITDDPLDSAVVHPVAAVTVPPPRRARIHDSMTDHMKSRKRHKEKITHESLGSPYLHPAGVVTVTPPRRRAISSDNAPRGLKRKAGCIESALQTGRTKKIECEYDMGSELGKGKFGVVRICKNKATGEEMACKTLAKKGPESVHNEVQVMQHLSGHPNIVTLKAVFEDADSIHLVMEICSGGRLVDSMRKNKSYSEQQAAKIIKELVEVIKYCHEMGVVHRDIKPENILLTTDGHVKLADFGLSVHAPEVRNLSGQVGSPAYVAPEIFSETYTEKVDVWSAGVLLHALLIGMLPFRGESVEAIFEKIKSYEQLDFQNEMWNSVSGPAKDLLSRMLSRDAEKRLSSEDVLYHPWIMFYTDPRIRLQTRGSRKKYKSHVRSLIAPSVDRQDRKQDTANLILNKRSEDDSISGHLQRKSLLNAACCTQPSYPVQLNLVVRQYGECDLVDVLSAAISQLTISRPKRSRGPALAYVPPLGCSQNLHMTLCKAF